MSDVEQISSKLAKMSSGRGGQPAAAGGNCSPVPSPVESSSKKLKPHAQVHLLSPTEKCKVCHEPAAKHIHYGAMTCFSCRAFFRRSIQNKTAPTYVCRRQQTCEITLKSRKNCQYCRYKKCLKVGMKPSWVLSEEERQRRFRKNRERKAAGKADLEGIDLNGDEVPADFDYNFISQEADLLLSTAEQEDSKDTIVKHVKAEPVFQEVVAATDKDVGPSFQHGKLEGQAGYQPPVTLEESQTSYLEVDSQARYSVDGFSMSEGSINLHQVYDNVREFRQPNNYKVIYKDDNRYQQQPEDKPVVVRGMHQLPKNQQLQMIVLKPEEPSAVQSFGLLPPSSGNGELSANSDRYSNSISPRSPQMNVMLTTADMSPTAFNSRPAGPGISIQPVLSKLGRPTASHQRSSLVDNNPKAVSCVQLEPKAGPAVVVQHKEQLPETLCINGQLSFGDSLESPNSQLKYVLTPSPGCGNSPCVSPLNSLLRDSAEEGDEQDDRFSSSSSSGGESSCINYNEPEIKFTMEEEAQLRMLVQNHNDRYKSVNFGEELIKEMIMCSMFGIPVSTSAAINGYRLSVERITKVAHSLESFQNLAKQDQASLLKENVDLLVSLRGAMFFDSRKRGFDQVLISMGVEDLETIKTVFKPIIEERELKHIDYKTFNSIQTMSDSATEARYNFLQEQVGRTLQDDVIPILLTYIILFSVDFVPLKDKRGIEQIQEKFTVMLQRYIYSKQSRRSAPTVLAQTLNAVTYIREMADIKKSRAINANVKLSSN